MTAGSSPPPQPVEHFREAVPGADAAFGNAGHVLRVESWLHIAVEGSVNSTVAGVRALSLRTSHRYRGGGSYPLRITATDRAGNQRVSLRTVRIG